MKRSVVLIVMIALLASIFLTGFVIPGGGVNWGDPTTMPIMGDTAFIAKVVDPSSLPGTYIGAGGYPLPSGFIEGDAQFGGKGLVLSGVDFGLQQTCFPFPTYYYGWRGSVYGWDGAKWVKYTTTITEGQDGAITTACAKTFGNGSYALLVGFNQALAPAPALPPEEECTSDLGMSYWEWGPTFLFNVGVRFTGTFQPELGQPYTWKIENVKPVNFLTPLSGSGKTAKEDDENIVSIRDTIYTDGGYPDTSFSFTIKVYIPDCHKMDITVEVPK